MGRTLLNYKSRRSGARGLVKIMCKKSQNLFIFFSPCVNASKALLFVKLYIYIVLLVILSLRFEGVGRGKGSSRKEKKNVTDKVVPTTYVV